VTIASRFAEYDPPKRREWDILIMGSDRREGQRLRMPSDEARADMLRRPVGRLHKNCGGGEQLRRRRRCLLWIRLTCACQRVARRLGACVPCDIAARVHVVGCFRQLRARSQLQSLARAELDCRTAEDLCVCVKTARRQQKAETYREARCHRLYPTSSAACWGSAKQFDRQFGPVTFNSSGAFGERGA
jgi:hypothetical protein